MSSLKEQLLKAGLVKPNQVKNRPKKKAPTPAKRSRNKVSEQTRRAQRAMLDKAKKDKKLNEQRQAEAQRKALQAQIRQLVEGSKLDRSSGEIAFSFTHKKKIKSIYVTEEQQTQLSNGQIAIVDLAGTGFELIPNKAAEQISQRDSNAIIEIKGAENMPDADDPYADFQVPDDLNW